MVSDNILEKIRRCLALSTSSNEHEAAAALQKAHELLVKHNLALEDIYTRFGNKPAMMDVRVPLGHQDWKRILVSRVASFNYCYGMFVGSDIQIIGRPDNVAATAEMSAWLINQLEVLATSATILYEGSHRMSYRNSYLLGAVTTIRQRLKAIRQQENANPTTTALVVLDSEAEAYAQQHYHPRSVSLGRNRNLDGYHAGRVAGDQVSLTPPSKQID